MKTACGVGKEYIVRILEPRYVLIALAGQLSICKLEAGDMLLRHAYEKEIFADGATFEEVQAAYSTLLFRHRTDNGIIETKQTKGANPVVYKPNRCAARPRRVSVGV